jgi:hypothetical protein
MSASAGRARLRRVGFTDALHGHSVQSRLVLDHVYELAVGPLVEPLVRFRSVVDPLSDSCQIAHYNRSDPSLVEGLDQPRGLLVQEILDLVSDLAQLSVLGANQTLPSPTAALFAGNLLRKPSRGLILLTTQTSKLSAVDGPSLVFGVDSSKVNLPDVDTRDL